MGGEGFVVEGRRRTFTSPLQKPLQLSLLLRDPSIARSEQARKGEAGACGTCGARRAPGSGPRWVQGGAEGAGGRQMRAHPARLATATVGEGAVGRGRHF